MAKPELGLVDVAKDVAAGEERQRARRSGRGRGGGGTASGGGDGGSSSDDDDGAAAAGAPVPSHQRSRSPSPQRPADAAVDAEPQSSTAAHRGVVVDCGSGHTSIMVYSYESSSVRQVQRAWLKHADGGNLPLTDVLPGAKGQAFKGITVASRTEEFIALVQLTLADPTAFYVAGKRSTTSAVGSIDSLYVGATGGMREQIAQGNMGEAEVAVVRSGFERAFGGAVRVVKFEVLTGGQEASWEHAAAQITWGAAAGSMFPADKAAAAGAIGLFSGGGKSMQLGREGSAISFPFSTFPAELEERQGAAPDAWLDPVKWDRFADELVAKVQKAAAAGEHERFNGNFVGTAMNHRAAHFTEIAEQPITAAAAAKALRASLAQFRAQEGGIYERMQASANHPSYPLARITAMHTFSLATVLELMFEPDAQFFFAAIALDSGGSPIDCEWTVGAFAELARADAAGAGAVDK